MKEVVKITNKSTNPKIWGGIECTINRKNNIFKDQLHLSKHYERTGDLETFATLGIEAIRYPVLWEKHISDKNGLVDWSWSTHQLTRLRELNIMPIVGLLHHGSGPSFTSLLDKDFANLLAAYAKKVAIQFPWIEYYTPINEPLTTARFSGLYGFWYPHKKNEFDFLTMLLNQVEGIILSMNSIREVNPSAKLVQTEDIGKTHSTPKLRYQADFENNRRWLTYDLLCGRVNPNHQLWNYFINNGIKKERLYFFLQNPCFPDIAGFNYYVTSERYLDERVEKYPNSLIGSNEIERYADIEATRIIKPLGIKKLLKEAWSRYHLPITVSEAHLNCTREDQLRWFKEIWDHCCKLTKEGIDIKSVTAWSLLGAYDWNSLLVKDNECYETGVYDITNFILRPTAMVKLIRSLSTSGTFNHPLLQSKGWWYRHNPGIKKNITGNLKAKVKPLLIIGKTGTLGNAFGIICEQRGVHYKILSRQDIEITDRDSIIKALNNYKPWGIINAAGYVKVDNAETHIDECFAINTKAPGLLAEECKKYGIPFMTFSTDMVFGGDKLSPYLETDKVFPLNVYGKSKAEGETAVIIANPNALVIRTSAFFGPWDKYNFVYDVLHSLEQQRFYSVVKDVVISPTYVPDLVNYSLDLFIDEVNGIWHLSNDGRVTWADFAVDIAKRSRYSQKKILPISASEMEWKALRPLYSVLESEKGVRLPVLTNALERYFLERTM